MSMVSPESFYDHFRSQRGIAYTTDSVLDKTFTLLFKRLPLPQARESMDRLDEAIQKGYLHLEWITPERFEEAESLRLKLQDKPRISFTDLTSMVVMNQLGLTDILTEDAHFAQVGMGLLIVP